MPKKKLKVKPLGRREAVVVPPRSKPKKKLTKDELEAQFQTMVERKYKKGQISKSVYQHYKSPTRHVTKAGDPSKWEKAGLPELSKAKKKKKAKTRRA